MSKQGVQWSKTFQNIVKKGVAAAKVAKAVYNSVPKSKKSLKSKRKLRPLMSQFTTKPFGNSSSNATKSTIKLRTIGKVNKVNTNFIKKVLNASSARNCYVNQNSLAQSASVAKSQYSFFDLNSNADLTTIQGYAVGSPTGKYLLEDSSIDITMANMSTAPAYCRMYECVPRVDIPTPLGSYTNIYVTGINQANTSGTAIQADALESKLYDSHMFVSYFKVVSQKNYTLDPGMNLKITQTIGSKVINTNMISASNTQICARYGRVYVFKYGVVSVMMPPQKLMSILMLLK